MNNTTLVLVVVVLLVILLVYKKPKAEHVTLADRLGTQSSNISTALQMKLETGLTPSQEEFGDPYADVQKALDARRFEVMCSPQNNTDEPLCEALHGGSAVSAM